MSKGTIKYSQEFKSELGNKWIGIDLVVNENDDFDKMFSEAESMVKRWGGIWLSSTSYSLGTVPYDRRESIEATPIQSIDPRAKDLKEIIEDATSLEELEKLKDEAGRLGLLSAYSSKLLTFKK